MDVQNERNQVTTSSTTLKGVALGSFGESVSFARVGALLKTVYTNFCMSQKVEKPVLSGQRIKTRKRDEKERYDPVGFRDAIISGLDKCSNDFEAISRYLDSAGNKLDYRRYGECLFDILIAGGILVPGGTLSQEGDGPYRSEACIFNTPDEINMEIMKHWEQVFIKLMRRYKYLEKLFQDEIKKILMFVKYFQPSDRKKLSIMVYIWIANGSIPFNAVLVLNNSHLVKDHLALDFLIDMFKAWRQEKGVNSLHSAIKKSNFEPHLTSFIPDTKQSQLYFRNAFQDNGLDEILKLYNDQHQQLAKKELQVLLADSLSENKPQRDIINEIKEIALRENILEHETACIIWATIMDIPEWSKKEELVTEQAVRHLQYYTSLFAAFTESDRSELSLLLKVQDYCYSNMIFMKAFQKIIMLFYKKDVISEQTILKWYKQDFSVKGKMMKRVILKEKVIRRFGPFVKEMINISATYHCINKQKYNIFSNEPWAYQGKIRGMSLAGGSLFYCTSEARPRAFFSRKKCRSHSAARLLPQGPGSGEDQCGRRYKGKDIVGSAY
ncbi:hypothetical protein JTB14_017917 [Gonioctena quinquepunctata]|nr:hypothetical protein JTB14_017917 [Gonioctena quinquepunctata]